MAGAQVPAHGKMICATFRSSSGRMNADGALPLSF